MNYNEQRDRLGRLSYSVAEAAQVTGLSKTTLYNLMGKGELRFCMIGARRLIRSDDLLEMINSASRQAA